MDTQQAEAFVRGIAQRAGVDPDQLIADLATGEDPVSPERFLTNLSPLSDKMLVGMGAYQIRVMYALGGSPREAYEYINNALKVEGAEYEPLSGMSLDTPSRDIFNAYLASPELRRKLAAAYGFPIDKLERLTENAAKMLQEGRLGDLETTPLTLRSLATIVPEVYQGADLKPEDFQVIGQLLGAKQATVVAVYDVVKDIYNTSESVKLLQAENVSPVDMAVLCVRHAPSLIALGRALQHDPDMVSTLQEIMPTVNQAMSWRVDDLSFLMRFAQYAEKIDLVRLPNRTSATGNVGAALDALINELPPAQQRPGGFGAYAKGNAERGTGIGF